MAGTDARFNGATFRTNIRFAMNMGLPVNVGERPTFLWNPIRTYTKEDGGGNPFSWETSPATSVQHPPVQIACAYQFGAATEDDTAVGDFDITKASITVLDEDYALLTVGGVFANQVKLGGNLYDIEYVAPPYGLFDVTVYQIHCTAVDES